MGLKPGPHACLLPPWWLTLGHCTAPGGRTRLGRWLAGPCPPCVANRPSVAHWQNHWGQATEPTMVRACPPSLVCMLHVPCQKAKAWAPPQGMGRGAFKHLAPGFGTHRPKASWPLLCHTVVLFWAAVSATTGSQLGPEKTPGVWCHLGGLHLPTMAGQCTPAAPCHAPCVSHPNPTWPRRQPSQHPLSQAPVQPPTGHRLGATRRQGKPPGWQGLCSRGLGPRGGHTTGALAPHTPGLAKRAFCRCTRVPQRGGFLRHQPTAPTKIPRAAA